jgi:excisionase family DNA binding protein
MAACRELQGSVTIGGPMMLDAHSVITAARDRSLAFDGVTIKQVAAMLGVTVRTVRRWQAAGKMPERFKHGRRKLYRGAHVRALAEGTPR